MADWLLNTEILVYAAGLLFVIGYLIVDQVYLRLLLLVGTLLYIVYYSIAADTPLWGAIYTSVLTGAANVIGLCQLLISRSAWAIPTDLRDLYPRFAHLPPGDFAALAKRATRHRIDTETTLATEGAISDALHYVLSGEVRVEKAGEQFTMPEGYFVGEVSLMLNRPASATVIAGPGTVLLTWPKADLIQRMAKAPQLRLTLEAAIARDMANKVARAVAAERT